MLLTMCYHTGGYFELMLRDARSTLQMLFCEHCHCWNVEFKVNSADDFCLMLIEDVDVTTVVESRVQETATSSLCPQL